MRTRRSAKWIAGVVGALGLLVAACGGSGSDPDTAESPTTAVEGAVDVIEDVHYATGPDGQALLDAYRPPSGVNLPMVVMVHGEAGSRKGASIAFAKHLAANGVVAISIDYPVGNPEAMAAADSLLLGHGISHVQCAVRLARDQAGAWSGNPDVIGVFGQSAGGLVGLTAIATNGADWPGDSSEVECEAEDEWPEQMSFAGLNGAHFIFDPQSPFHDSGAWERTNPQTLLEGQCLRAEFILGGQDTRTPQWHKDLVAGLADGAPELNMTVVEQVGHSVPLDGPDLETIGGLVIDSLRDPEC